MAAFGLAVFAYRRPVYEWPDLFVRNRANGCAGVASGRLVFVLVTGRLAGILPGKVRWFGERLGRVDHSLSFHLDASCDSMFAL
jgi:hypothetical protein